MLQNKFILIILFLIIFFPNFFCFANDDEPDAMLAEREQFAVEMFFQNEEIIGPQRRFLTADEVSQLYKFAEARLKSIAAETRDLSQEEAHQYILEKIYGPGGLKAEVYEKVKEFNRNKTLPSNFEKDIKAFYLKYGKKFPVKVIIATIISTVLLIYLLLKIIKNKIVNRIIAIGLIVIAGYLIYLVLNNTSCSHQKIKKYFEKQKVFVPKSIEGKNIYYVKPLINTAYTAELIEDIDKANYTIVVSMYLAELTKKTDTYPNKIFEALIRAVQRDVNIYVMLDYPNIQQNVDLYKKNNVVKEFLENNKIKVIWDSPQIENHEKIILIDEQVLYVCSHNWSYEALTNNEEVSFKIYAYKYPVEVLNYFYNPFEGQVKAPVILKKMRINTDALIKAEEFSFLESYKYFYKLKKELLHTKKSVKIKMFLIRTVSMNDDDKVYQLLSILKQLKEQGKKIDVSLDASMEKENMPVYNLLKSYNINVRFSSDKIIMHTKIVLIDDKKIFCGSHNWSNSSFNTNREVSIYCKSSEIGKYLLKNLW